MVPMSTKVYPCNIHGPSRITISYDASESCARLLYLFNHAFEPLLTLFLEDITVPALLWCRAFQMIYRRFGIRNKGGLNGLVAMHLVKAQPSPKRADNMKHRQEAFSYRSRRQLLLPVCPKKNPMTDASDPQRAVEALGQPYRARCKVGSFLGMPYVPI
jgi:hypothetical protein